MLRALGGVVLPADASLFPALMPAMRPAGTTQRSQQQRQHGQEQQALGMKRQVAGAHDRTR